MPWLQGLQKLFSDNELVILTIHTPEMIHEYDGHLLKDKVRGFKLQLPVYIDNDHDYWNALQAHAWPSLYLIDKNGLIRYVFLGETHKYFVQARTIEKMIRELSQEQSDPNKQKK